MKKTFLFLSAAALLLAACNKTVTVSVPETSGPAEIGFKAIASNPTKGAELTGTLLPNTYGIFAAATQKNANGLIENPSFFTGNEQLFGTNEATPAAATLWHAGSYEGAPKAFVAAPQYWPIGGVKMDFLAYAMPMASHDGVAAGDWLAVWDNASTDVASQVTFEAVDTYANQEDILYAVANEMTGTSSTEIGGSPVRSVNLAFEHAQALLIFNVKVNSEADGKMTIKEIAYYTPERVNAMREHEQLLPSNPSHTLADLADGDVTLKTVGTFRVDNSRNELKAGWSAFSTKKENFKMPVSVGVSKSNNIVLGQTANDATQAYDAPIAFVAGDEYAQLGNTLLIPEQEKVNFTITYVVGGKTMFYTYNDLRGVWEKGKKYIYNLDLTLNEIVITESVADYTPVVEPVTL